MTKPSADLRSDPEIPDARPHCNSYVENGLEDKEDEDVCQFCLKADGGAAFVELFPGGSGSVADCLGVEINSWDMVTKICGDCVGGVKELAEFRAEFSPTAVPVMLEDVTDSSDSYSIGSENGEGGEGFESDSSERRMEFKRRCFCTCANAFRTSLALSPMNICTSCGSASFRKVDFVCATQVPAESVQHSLRRMNS
ncbi:conserved hypothetical protein [Culex quinquefasciatus]|uniref:ZAD domain-containing protein n=1 Tax=Culex quinquefasciatus TaxID=7176 RepID=B0WJC2_CULQU|nr:conserved hypothetical protein [Culex quinquefasciatus]|eukprot:XP_001848806.1 conserved hypothetical protein [Culex quinquefasciatus]